MKVACPCYTATESVMPTLDDGRCVLCAAIIRLGPQTTYRGDIAPEIPVELAAAYRLGALPAAFEWAFAIEAPLSHDDAKLLKRMLVHNEEQHERDSMYRSSYEKSLK